jgi:hypothetical protein
MNKKHSGQKINKEFDYLKEYNWFQILIEKAIPKEGNVTWYPKKESIKERFFILVGLSLFKCNKSTNTSTVVKSQETTCSNWLIISGFTYGVLIIFE